MIPNNCCDASPGQSKNEVRYMHTFINGEFAYICWKYYYFFLSLRVFDTLNEPFLKHHIAPRVRVGRLKARVPSHVCHSRIYRWSPTAVENLLDAPSQLCHYRPYRTVDIYSFTTFIWEELMSLYLFCVTSDRTINDSTCETVKKYYLLPVDCREQK